MTTETLKDKGQTAEKKVKNFYETGGWIADRDGHTTDAKLWEDLRPTSQAYVSACRLKVCEYLPKTGERLLDAASGPIQYPEYLEYSKGFKKRFCVDISQTALDQAQKKLGAHGEVVLASLLELPFESHYFDAAVSLHTIYHIDKDQQEKAVREIIRVLKKDAPAVIVYSNPDKILSRIKRGASALLHKSRPASCPSDVVSSEAPLYFHAHSLEWWSRFEDTALVKIKPWRFFTAQDAQKLIPPNQLGTTLLNGFLKFEKYLPNLATSWGAYPMIILTKR